MIELLLYGKDHTDALAARAGVRQKNGKAGVSKVKVTNLCVRSFGPHQPIMSCSGELVVPSRKGHPLGRGQLHWPSGLLALDPYVPVGCVASRYSPCTDACVLCGGNSVVGDNHG